MIWYLLYPFRGTTEPPTLNASHPLRRAFTQYGREAARHPVITLLISVTISIILIYPFPFLYTNDFTNGSSNLPHHVWTAAQPYESNTAAEPDVVMRSVWIHGSYMKALRPNVLESALDIQDELLGPTEDFNPLQYSGGNVGTEEDPFNLSQESRDSLHASHGWGDQSWFFHSPLQYWSGSKKAIAEDKDIIATVNSGAPHNALANVTLRHSIVFSGKRIEDHRLVAADALVITLFHKPGSPVGKQWEKKATELAQKTTGIGKFYPSDGWVTSNRLYGFRFQPLSFQDDVLLTLAYGLTALYFFFSLTRIRALKSRFGLTITVISQLVVSIMSSFTICAVLKIDLSKIPREAYPLVVLTIGLENMFRMINAVIVTPSQSASSTRIGEALGKTGHIALAGVGQNLFLLWLLYQVVHPGVQAFCIFAAIALIFDFLFLLTFFVAVLSVDVRRTELSDSLDRARRRPRRAPTKSTDPIWLDAFLRGAMPVTTRIAGTVVLVGFVLIAQWHFFDKEHPMRTISRMLRLIWSRKSKPEAPNESNLEMDIINQARTPTAWLRLQDHETIREVIQIVKPKAHSYIARVYDPLIIVLNGADRTPSNHGIRPFLPAVYDFMKHQSLTFLMTIFFVVAGVSLLMNYLLWGEERDEDDEQRAEDEPLLAVSTLDKGHCLDVAIITTSPAGVVVSIGLDRWIRVWDIRQNNKSHLVDTDAISNSLFPVQAVAMDDRARWLALASSTGHIALWNIRERRWGPQVQFEPTSRKLITFTFRLGKKGTIPPLIVISPNAKMLEFTFASESSGQVGEIKICKSPLVCARVFWDRSSSLSSQPLLCIVTASRRGCVHVVTERGGGWISEGIEALDAPLGRGVISVLPLVALRCFLAVRLNSVDLVDLERYTVLHSFETTDVVPETLRCLHSAPRKPQCGGMSVGSFSLAYNCRDTGEFVLRTLTSKRENEVICIGSGHNCHANDCLSWPDTVEQRYRLHSPGEWKTLPTGVIVGVRKRENALLKDYMSDNGTAAITGLRKRDKFLKQSRSNSVPDVDTDSWETWLLTTSGERLSTPLCADEANGNVFHLLTPSCGPIARIGQRSIAVGLGNLIKVVTVGHERYDGAIDTSENLASAMAGRRRKVTTIKRACSTAS